MKFHRSSLTAAILAGTLVYSSSGFSASYLEQGQEISTSREDDSALAEAERQMEREEAAIQNNLLLRSFYEWRYSLIFERSGPDTWSYGVSAWNQPEISTRSTMNSGQRIFRDNYVSRQIEAFSRDLRESIRRLQRAGQIAGRFASARPVSLTSTELSEALQEIAESVADLRGQFNLILPRFGGQKTNGSRPDDLLTEGDIERLEELERLIRECAGALQEFFYSSEHTVSVGSLVEGDFFTELERIGKAAEQISKEGATR